MPTISLALIAKNEEVFIARCLNSVRPFVDEMIVVDTGSTDRTMEIAASLGAKVSEFAWIDDFAAARNAAIERTTGDWILVLDADEYFECSSGNDAEKLQRFVSQGEWIGRITVKSRFLQNGSEQTVQARIGRLFPRSVRYQGAIHEQLASDLPRVDSGLALLHDGYYETDKSERNLRLLHKELERSPGNSYLLFHLAKEYRGLKDLAKSEQFFEQGFASMPDFNSEHAADATVDFLYVLLEHKNYNRALEVIEQDRPSLQRLVDFHFVCGLLFTDIALAWPSEARALMTMIEQSYLQCLNLGENGGREIVTGTGSFLAAYNLGVFYEMIGHKENAQKYYLLSSKKGYEPAKLRFAKL